MALEIHHKARTQRAIDKGQKSFRGRQDEGRDTHPTGIMDYLQFHGLLPTPIAWDGSARGGARPIKDGKTTYKHQYGARLKDMVKANLLPTPLSQGLKVCDKDGKTRFMPLDLLPTPTAAEGYKGGTAWNPNSQMGKSLSVMAASGMLPTPRTSGQEGYESRAARKGYDCVMSYLETTVDYVAHQTNSVPAGETSRLSPLFTEEVMGFPFLWTTLPFLSPDGRTKASKPTETP